MSPSILHHIDYSQFPNNITIALVIVISNPLAFKTRRSFHR